ncbi:hypothetical protein KC19_2G197400 [Ceratodon purpureus]|uniref:Uncharacterized protein n=1 Tax=Ceratodon purpureus TaxID=3225 RepID=A0A8T0IXE0_CERPU|nr:hypothetical protein KC19_2G197400 [Ceratodon purpureus]
MGFETFASGSLAAMISDEITLKVAVAFEDEIGLGFGLGPGIELAPSVVGSQEMLPYYSKHPEEHLIVGGGTQAAFVGSDAYPCWAGDLQARVQKNSAWQDTNALITFGKS